MPAIRTSALRSFLVIFAPAVATVAATATMSRLESDPSSAAEIQRMGLWAALGWAALGVAAAAAAAGRTSRLEWRLALASLLAPLALFALPPGTRSFATAALVIAVFAFSWERARRAGAELKLAELAAWMVSAQLILRAGTLLPGDFAEPRFWLRLLGLPLLMAWSTGRLGARFGPFAALCAAAAAMVLGPGATAHSTLALFAPALLLEVGGEGATWRRLGAAALAIAPFFWEPRAAAAALLAAALVAPWPERRRWPRLPRLAAGAAVVVLGWASALAVPARSALPALAAAAVAGLLLAAPVLRRARGLRALQAGLLGAAALLAALAAAPPWFRPDPLRDAGGGLLRWVFGRPFAPTAAVLRQDRRLDASSPRWSATVAGSPRRVLIESNLGNAADLPAGTEVARLYLRDPSDGSTLFEAPLHAGSDTGEWAARRADLAGRAAAGAPAPWRSSFTPDRAFFGQTYRAEIATPDLDPPLELAVVRSPALPAETMLVLRTVDAVLRGSRVVLSRDDPFRGTLLALPVVLALFVLTARVARRAGARAPRPSQAAGLALATLLIGVLLRSRLTLPHLDLVLAAGLALLLASTVGARLLALRPALGRRMPRRPSIAFFLLPLAVYLAILPWSTDRRPPDGDEPYYLLIAHSLAYDLDADLENNYAAADYRRFVDRPLEPQLGDPRGPHGEVFSRHNELLPLVLAPAYAAYGKTGALAMMAILAAALAWSTLRLARHYARDDPGAALYAYAIIAFASPLLFFSGQVWVEVPAALLAVISLDHLLMLRYDRHWGAKQWIGVALPILLLPLLKLRLMFLAGPLLALAWWHAGRPRKPLLVVAGLLGAVLGGVLIHNTVMFGNPLKIHGWEEIDPGRYRLSSYALGTLGFFFDGAFGLFAFFPLWLLLIAALWRLVRDRHPLLVDLLILGGPYLLMVGRRREWFGGWSPPFRYALVVLPLLAIAFVPILKRRRAAGARLLAGGLGALTLVLVVVWLIVPGWTYNLADGRSDVVDQLENRWGLDVGRFVPSAVRPRAALGWAAGLSLLAVPALYAWRGRRLRLGASAWAPAGALIVVAAFCALPYAARHRPTRVVEFEDPWVRKLGGHVYPDLWTVDRPLYTGGWILRGGERLEAKIVPGGRSVSLRLPVRYVRNTPAPIRLRLSAGSRTLAEWTPERPDVWQTVEFGPFDWPRGAPLVVAAVGPAAETPLAGLTVDRVEMRWR